METQKDTGRIEIVPNRVLKGIDGREPFAEKIEKANAALKKAGVPKIPLKK
ncbi:hypothetical protein [Larkinella terrae]|uniref:Uncharacterized protein n=1 Tax=Larkinella terrae TaxID=2025311 RepID=A0A7K0ESR5_9BACT|nr:hypothetical protein [Larkinella terrae]MRS64865.1 hypothetical protein [Larkinella terrae]